MIHLLNSWSRQLRELKLNFGQQHSPHQPTAQWFLHPLFDSIQQLTNLKHLFFWHNGFLYPQTGYHNLALPILSQLDTIYFSTTDGAEILVRSLKRYATANEAIDIAIINSIQTVEVMQAYLSLDRQLARRIRRLRLTNIAVTSGQLTQFIARF